MDLDSFLAVAQRLLAVPSTADRPAELSRALDLVLNLVGGDHSVERFTSGGKPSALVYRAGARPPEFRVILNAHLDVVPAGDAQFQPHRDGDRLYARGAHDMKVTGLLQAMVFAELVDTLPYPLALQLVTDEEVGGQDGTGHQLAQGVTGAFVVIGEQSRLDVVADSKGLAHVYLRATGVGGHGAYPWLGDNALISLMDTIRALLARYPVPAREVWRTTLNVARIETGNTAFNQIPADAQAWLDFRFPPEDPDFNGVPVAELTRFLTEFCRPGVSVLVDQVDHAQHADHDRPEVTALRAAVRRQGYPGEFLRKHGAGDGRYYAQRGIEAVAFGIGGGGQHGPAEYAEISTIEPYYQALRDFLTGIS